MTTLGLAITTYARPISLQRIIDDSREWTLRPSRVVVADNSLRGFNITGAEIIRQPDNPGVGAGVASCLSRLTDMDCVLILDDDTLLSLTAAEQMALAVSPQVGAVTIPGNYVRELHRRQGGVPRTFPWSPTLVVTQAVEAIGLPRTDLFFTWDDIEYGLRMHQAGFQIVFLPLEEEQPQLKAGSVWLGSSYLASRNMTYLLARGKLRDSIVMPFIRERIRGALRTGPRGRAIRRGLFDGLRGEVGKPPRDLMPDGDFE